MPSLSHPLQFVVVALAGWINQRQREIIDYLQEETVSCANGSEPGACASPTTSAVGSPRKPGSWDEGCCVRDDRDAGHVGGVAPDPHRQAIRREYASWSSPAASESEIRALIVRMATENAAGATRGSQARWRTSITRSPEAPSPPSSANTAWSPRRIG